MEKYRAELKKRLPLYAGLCALVPLSVLALNWWSGRVLENTNDHTAAFMHGLSISFVFLLMAYAISQIFLISRALKDDSALKKMHIKETDERTIFIQSKAGGGSMRLVIILLVFASIVASYFSPAVMFTLVASALGASLVMFISKLYYSSRY